jgi:hypothetical protein
LGLRAQDTGRAVVRVAPDALRALVRAANRTDKGTRREIAQPRLDSKG